MTYFIGDCHFGDENILRIDNRPFSTVKEMDDAMIENWNSAVNDDDTIYVVGDFGAEGHEEDILNKLKGTICLIRGNHDSASNKRYRDAGFSEVYDKPIILDDYWIVSHKPMFVSKNSPYANIFAHVHDNPIYSTVSCRSYCVSASRIGYMPICFSFIKQCVKNCI